MIEKYKAQQDETEISSLIDLARRENVKSYLEIGSRNGGSLWRIAKSLPTGSKIVSVDLPWGNRETEPNLRECVTDLNRLGYDVTLILGDSTSREVIYEVTRRAPFDLIFIDANHTEPYVRKDWANYGNLGRLIAFHDIGWIARPNGGAGKLPIDVPKVWEEIKFGRRHVEFKMCQRDNGIGVVWQ